MQTDESGLYKGEFDEVKQKGKWEIVASWTGDKTYEAAKISKTIDVIKGLSQITWQLLPKENQNFGDKISVIAQLKPALEKQTINVQIVKPNGISTLDNTVTEQDGAIKVDLELSLEGIWKIIAIWEGNENYEKVISLENQIIASRESPKAIIVLGGGDKGENPAWNKFSGLAKHVYTILKNRKLTDNDIYYLSPEKELPEVKVDRTVSNSGLEFAITEWAAEKVGPYVPLFIYLLSHNLNDKLILKKQATYEEILTPGMLNGWLDLLPKGTEVTIIIEACHSGNFITRKIGERPVLSKSGRTIITSAKDDKQAIIEGISLLSFTRIFFDEISRNSDVKTAFLNTSNVLRASRSFQSPQIDADGNGIANDPTRDFLKVENKYIPANIELLPSVPQIQDVSKHQKLKAGEKSATIKTRLTGVDISSVFGIAIPPNYDPNRTFNDWSKVDFEKIKFEKKEEGLYEGIYDNFSQDGTYTIVLNAENRDGNAIPVETKIKVLAALSIDKLLLSPIEQGAKDQEITITGMGFDGEVGEEFGGTVVFSGTKIKVNSKKYISSTQLIVSISVDSDVEIGLRDVTITNPGDEKGVTKIAALKIENATPCPPWDVNCDGEVNISDMIIVASNLDQTIVSLIKPNPDVNMDNKIDIFDIILVGKHFGEKTDLKASPVRDFADRDIISDALSDVDLLIWLSDLLKEIPNANSGILKVMAELERLIAIAKNLPSETKLYANYPNPFNPETWIPFSLAEASEVTIRIYNIKGELVRTLSLGWKGRGFYLTKDKAAYWDGRNDIGERVASGLYFYQFQASNFFDIRKMLLLK